MVCFGCMPSDAQLYQLLDEMKRDNMLLKPVFHALDHTRINSIIDSHYGSFQYKNKSNEQSFNSIIQQEWQFKLNNDKRVLEKT